MICTSLRTPGQCAVVNEGGVGLEASMERSYAYCGCKMSVCSMSGSLKVHTVPTTKPPKSTSILGQTLRVDAVPLPQLLQCAPRAVAKHHRGIQLRVVQRVNQQPWLSLQCLLEDGAPSTTVRKERATRNVRA